MELTLCSIITRNFLAQARVMALSIRRFHPTATICVLVVDTIEGYFDASGEPFTVMTLEALSPANVPALIFPHTARSACSALKPRLLAHLFATTRADALIYFDADILLTAPLHDLFKSLTGHSIVLTPHVGRLTRATAPSAQLFGLAAGLFNAGFIGLARSAETDEFLAWWTAQVDYDCTDRPEAGVHYDQRWLDLAPHLFDSLQILSGRGYNIGYWNYRDYELSHADNQFFADDQALGFFHFSGFDPHEPGLLTQRPGYVPGEVPPTIQQLTKDYAELLLGSGYDITCRWTYGLENFANGEPVPAEARQAYRDLEERERFGDPFAVGGGSFYEHWSRREPGRRPGKSLLQRLLGS